MDLKWLETFVCAARNENFRKAAEELYISQPTVTVQIKLLESHLGSVLFERVGRRVRLTEAGRRFLPHAKQILLQQQAGMSELQRLQQGYTKTLRLAVSPLIAAYSIPFALSRYVRSFPEVEVSVQVAESKEIAGLVLRDEIDLGLSRLHVQHDDLSCRILAEDRVLLVAPHDGLDSEHAEALEMESILQAQTILTHNHPEYWDDLLLRLKQLHLPLRTMTVSQVHITKRFIEEGLGVSFLPESAVRRELLEGRLLEVYCGDFPLPSARTYAITREGHETGQHFLQFLKRFRLS
ncbi:LysR family transcriptional regulator [Ectobacillus ponti]|uniref:LysR family transcriptional regulator n=1 Tax=Ectobacillus ponti TaxID=2961894 RepID=A0AA42BNX8_9BACI|nr:LysR family transcriptional regulator [Ectobacillus ponti]MCP8968187.1 LysR family transcriptional regulator [Ectobacillus ponti]